MESGLGIGENGDGTHAPPWAPFKGRSCPLLSCSWPIIAHEDCATALFPLPDYGQVQNAGRSGLSGDPIAPHPGLIPNAGLLDPIPHQLYV